MGVRKLVSFTFICDFCMAPGPTYHDRPDFGDTYPEEVPPGWAIMAPADPDPRYPYAIRYMCQTCRETLGTKVPFRVVMEGK